MDSKRYVYAIRIFNENDYKPMAELAFGDGGRPNGETITIEWDDINEREKYVINAYTFIWDERDVVKEKTFDKYVKGEDRKMSGNFIIVYDYDNHKTIIKTNEHTKDDIEKIQVSILSGDEVGTIFYKDGTEQKFDAFTDPRGRYDNLFYGTYVVEDIPLWLNFKPDEDNLYDTFAYQRERYYEGKIAEKGEK